MKNISNFELALEDYSISLSACTLTQEIKTPQKLISILNQSNYQVIPPLNTKLDESYDWKFIKNICDSNKTKNKLLDICLPFNIAKGKKKKIELVRVLMLNNTIVGIRIQSHSEGDRRKSNAFKFPADIKKWCDSESCKIGQFYLHISNSKIALLFQSQINLFPNILQEYISNGCEIFSIVNDTPLKSKQQNQLLHSKIKQFSTKYKTCIIYSSLLYVMSLESIYQGKSYISLGGLNLIQSSISMFDQSQSIYIKIKSTDIKRLVVQSQTIQHQYNIIPSVTLNHYLIDTTHTIPFKTSAFTKYFQQFDQNLINIYHIWYLYKNINQKCPFILSTKDNPTAFQLINSIYKLSQKIQDINRTNYEQKEMLKKLLVLYNNNKSNIEQKLMRKVILELEQNYVQNNELANFLTSQRYQKICFYTEDTTQIQNTKKLLSKKFKAQQIMIMNDFQQFKVNNKRFIMKKQVQESLPIHNHSQKIDQKIVEIKINQNNYQKQVNAINQNVIVQQNTDTSFIDKQQQSPRKEIQIQQFRQDLIQIQDPNQKTCHICHRLFDISHNLTLTCQCQNTFCFDCLDLYKISTFSFGSCCPICQSKCPCIQCKFKHKMFQNNCHKCGVSLQMILKKKSSSLITVQCSSKRCDIKYCTNCISEFQQLDPLLYKFQVKSFHSWLCYRCRKICNCLLCDFQKKNKLQIDLKNRQLFVQKQNIQMNKMRNINIHDNQKGNQQRQKLYSVKFDRNRFYSRQRSRQDKIQSQQTNNKTKLKRNTRKNNQNSKSNQANINTQITQTISNHNYQLKNNNLQSSMLEQDNDNHSDFSFAAYNLLSSPYKNYPDLLFEEY